MASDASAPDLDTGQASGLPWLRFLIVAFLVALDQLSKSAVVDWFPTAEGVTIDHHGHRRVPILGDWFAIMEPSYNRGAAFGKLGDFPHLLIGGRVLAVGLLTWLLLRIQRGQRLTLWAMVLVLAGAIGNLVDNLWTGGNEPGHPYGTVRDFIDVWFTRQDFHFWSFNVADACISVGAVFWILASFLPQPDTVEDPPPDADPSAVSENG